MIDSKLNLKSLEITQIFTKTFIRIFYFNLEINEFPKKYLSQNMFHIFPFVYLVFYSLLSYIYLLLHIFIILIYIIFTY